MKIFLKKEKVKPNYSIWLTFDSLILGGVFYFSPVFTILCVYYMYSFFLGFSGLVFILFGRKLYDKNILRTDNFRKMTAVIRSAIYSVVIVSFSIPFIVSGTHNKWGYPVRRAMFLSRHKSIAWHTIMPEHLPDRTDNYTIKLSYGFGPATSGADISFYTDSSVIEEYKRTAQEYGAEYCTYSPEDEITDENGKYKNEDENTFFKLKMINLMRDTGASEDDIQNAEIYIFSKSYRYVFIWILNEKTGYFRAYA